jgi:hypothetical protein
MMIEQDFNQKVMSKVCLKCNELKDFSHFGIDRSRNNGLMSRCKSCREIACDICDKKLSSKTKMIKHKMSVHRGIKPYKCSVCNYETTTMYNLESHQRHIH